MGAALGIVGKLKAKPGKEAELAALFEELSALAKQHEPGMLQHVIFRNPAEPGVFTVVEVFRDREAFEAHAKTPHYPDVGRRLIPLIDGQLGGVPEMLEVIAHG